jgi:DNA-directed RNA polymerase subunit K/omega
MAREAKKQEPDNGEAEPEQSLEQLILDRKRDKYSLVSLSSLWALELRRREENRHLSQTEILDIALRDLMSGKVKPEQVEKAAAAAAALAARPADGKEKK